MTGETIMDDVVITYYDALPPDYVPVDMSIPAPALTRRQLRLQLLSMGITSAMVQEVINAMDEPARSVAQINWEDSSVYERGHPLVAQLGTAFGLTTEQIDAAWAAALVL